MSSLDIESLKLERFCRGNNRKLKLKKIWTWLEPEDAMARGDRETQLQVVVGARH